MKKLIIIFIFLGNFILSLQLIADDFPSSYINRELAETSKLSSMNISILKPGQLASVNYVGRSIFIYRRTKQELDYLSNKNNLNLADPTSENLKSSIEASYGSSSSYVWTRLLLHGQPKVEKLLHRSKNKEFFVVAGWSPHSGCVLNFFPPEHREREGVSFTDPCVKASFDGAGRILKGNLEGIALGRTAKYNLFIPPYRFNKEGILLIGESNPDNLPDISYMTEKMYLGMNSTEKLISASRYNDLKMVKQSLSEGANANYYVYGEGGPLDAAIIGSSIDIINLLVKNGAKPTVNSINAATFVKRTEVVQLLKKLSAE